MGKGKSSDTYFFNILHIDEDRRQFQITLKSTGASGDYELPEYGLEALFLMILLGWLPYNVTNLDLEEVETEDKHIARVAGRTYSGTIDISKFVHDNIVTMTPEEREEWRENLFDHWEALSEERKQPYIEWNNQKKMRIKQKKYELVQQGNYPPLAYEIPDWDVNFDEIAWKFIQSVRLDNIKQGLKPKGTYTIFVTDPKWLMMIEIGGQGTTAYEQNLQPIHWTPETHRYFPRSFRLITIQLLMMRLPRHKQNNAQNIIGMVPHPIFLEILSYLAVLSYSDKDPVPEWEIRMVSPHVFDKQEKRETVEAKQKRRHKNQTIEYLDNKRAKLEEELTAGGLSPERQRAIRDKIEVQLVERATTKAWAKGGFVEDILDAFENEEAKAQNTDDKSRELRRECFYSKKRR